MQAFESSNHTLHFRFINHRAKHTLVFVNSLGTNMQIWDEVVRLFGHRYNFLLYDKAGHGLSSVPNGYCSISDHANDLEALIAFLNLKQVIVVGISMGGMIAMQLASQNPELIQAVVLSNTSDRIGSETFWNDRIVKIQKNGLDTWSSHIMARWLSEAFRMQNKALTAICERMLSATAETGYIRACEAIRDAKLDLSLLPKDLPILGIVGSEDHGTTVEMMQKLSEKHLRMNLEVIEQCGHLTCIEQPGQMTHTIQSFLAQNKFL